VTADEPSGGLRARTLEVEDGTDLVEFCYEQGWTDGIPGAGVASREIRQPVVETKR
jgi:hypothetical protein